MFWNSLRYAIRSPRWKTVRKNFLKDHPKCAACGSTKDLEVHHIKPVHKYPDLELDPSNLITLCSKYCHLSIGHLMDFKSYNSEVLQDSANFLNKVNNRP